jgi:2-methylcitrate dehydratase PrpD
VSEGANAAHIGRFLSDASGKPLSAVVVDAAKKCLVDWLGVAIAGAWESFARAVKSYAELDDATLPIIGAAQDVENAALVNGVAAHALNFDDTHIPTDSHISAVTWAALLAFAERSRVDEQNLLQAFIADYKIVAKFVSHRFGFNLRFCWFHLPAVIGKLASSVAVTVVMVLDEPEAVQAVGLSATGPPDLRNVWWNGKSAGGR